MGALERIEATDIDQIAQRVLDIGRRGLITAVVLLSAVALWQAWPFQTMSAGFQGLGVLLTLLGLAAIGDWLQQGAKAVAIAGIEGRRRAAIWLRNRREQLTYWRARLLRRPRPAIIRAGTASASASTSGSLVTAYNINRVDRDTISDRDWLAYLDDRVHSLSEQLRDSEERRSEDRSEFDRRLGIQRSELRAEIVRETRNGWLLVFWGLMSTFAGIVLGALA